jgi:CHAT domain-containing protein
MAIATETIPMANRLASALAVAALAAVFATPAIAQSLGVRDSFRIGSGQGSLCTAQSVIADPALVDMFDRGFAITCRDAAVPVGQVFELRTRRGDPLARLDQMRSAQAVCAPAEPARVAGLAAVETRSCRLASGDVGYRVYIVRAGNRVFVAQGLAGYDSALQLALRSVIADREVEGEVSVATTGAGDPAAFARAQAGTLDPQRALAEAYRRNNAGSYAEAAEFFGQLVARDQRAEGRAEALVNAALQKSNLGRFGEADLLLSQARDLAGEDPVLARRLRNYRAMHLLNQGLAADAVAELDRPMPGNLNEGIADLVIDHSIAARLSSESPGADRLGGSQGLSATDRARILDGQALQLRGTIHRITHREADAVVSLIRAQDELVAIGGGRSAATIWMRAQIFSELASIAESRGDLAEAERLHGEGIALLDINYPGSAALLSARGRLAGLLARTGRAEPAVAIYRQIVAAVAGGSEASPALRPLLEPYFELLVRNGGNPAAADLFVASQVLVRPGVAQTQAVLARELSGGSDDASRLFRQSVNLTREIERSRVELARLETGPNPDPQRAALLRAEIEQLQQTQAATQSQLAAFPRYRAVADNSLTLPDLQQLLRPGEAYYKMMVVNDDAYGIFITADTAAAFRIGATPAELERQVDALRATISTVENGQQLTYPFDVALSRRLYEALFSPVAERIGSVRHLIFEPDGALLRLPINLLVAEAGDADAYLRRAAARPEAEFDFRGIAWLGRDRDISTAVSAPAFRDVRRAAPSRAASAYLGFGQNAPAGSIIQAGGGTRGSGTGDPCSWPLLAWSRPIAADELHTASGVIRSASGGAAEVITGAAFSDTAIKSREDLDGFRVLHFATHGLVGSPRPECPTRPALLTSFGGEGSDGLLTFAEIFDLRLDADLIILSACDTASQAGALASQEAGVTSGGDFSLDGLVRAFVGAGGRMVVASHWPVPDDYDATERLIAGLFSAPPGTGTSAALRAAQTRLMDQADTSHPYYWSGFAVVGDGSAPVIRRGEGSAAGTD